MKVGNNNNRRNFPFFPKMTVQKIPIHKILCAKVTVKKREKEGRCGRKHQQYNNNSLFATTTHIMTPLVTIPQTWY